MNSTNHKTAAGERRPVGAQTTIAEVMTASPHTIGREQKLCRAHDFMRQYGVRHLPVLEGGDLVGVLSQRDLYFNESIVGVDVEMDSVEEAMTREVFTAAPEECVGSVARRMAQHKYGCAVVVDRGHIVGIFTATDALALLATILA